MLLRQLKLQYFRNHSHKEFKFSAETTLIVGANASGKTNLLEAICLLATGKSFRAQLEKEMIAYGQPVARVEGRVKQAVGEQADLAMVLTTGQVNGERAPKKRCLVNGVGKRLMDFVGQLKVVYFGPEDLEIIVDSPSIRRDYLDTVLQQVDREYYRASLSYQKGLRQRNKLLEQIRDEGKPKSILFFWDKLLLENGGLVTQKREELINFINGQPDHFGQLQLTYDKSIISPDRLGKYEQEEVAAGMTLVGPHRDDFIVFQAQKNGKPRNLHIYGSRGEQRTAIFSLKLAEVEFIEIKTEARPVLLLDDIFSELDHAHRQRLLEVIPQQQTIITTTDIHLVEPEQRKKMALINL